VDGSDTDLLALGGNGLRSQHGGVGRRLVSVSLDLHPSGNTRDGFLSGKIGNVDESVVERGEDVSNTEHQSVVGLGAEVGDGVLLGGSDFGGLRNTS